MGDLASTWNFELDAEWVVPEMTFSVELLELEPGFEGEVARAVGWGGRVTASGCAEPCGSVISCGTTATVRADSRCQ